ncbi:MAG: NfeD family protein [Botrimarina sp.]
MSQTRRWRLAAAAVAALVATTLAAPACADVAAGEEAPAPPAPADAPAEQAGPESPAGEAAGERAVATIRVRLPLTGSEDAAYQGRMQRAVDRLLAEARAGADQRPLLILRLSADPDGGATEFERALRLARFLVSEQMARVKTLAYVPETIEGHAVLIALACEEIAMAPDAELGRAGIDEDPSRPVEPGIRASYEQIAQARRTAPPAVVLAMIDASVELVRVETDSGVEYVTGGELETLRAERAVVAEEVLAPSGALAVFTGREARREGVAKYLAADEAALARALSVPTEALREDEGLTGEWRPIMVDLTGPVTNSSVRRLESLLGDEIDRNSVNWIGVRIDSSGGDPAAAVRLAQTLADLGAGEARTVAYVPRRSEGPASLVALAADQLVIQEGAELRGVDAPDAAPAEQPLGPDAGEDAGDDAGADAIDSQLDAAVATVRESLAQQTSRGWSLLAATIDPSIELAVYNHRETGAVRIFSPEELDEQPDAQAWRRGERVKAAGERLSLPAARAAELGVAWQTVQQFDDLVALYGFEEPPRTAEPNWALELVEALASPGLAALLLVIAVVGLYIELNTPGLGVGGFIAAVAFLLFFWSKFLDGTADWLEVMLFVAGLVFVLMELIVLPGFGIFGLGGGLLIIASLVLASQTFILPKTDSQMVELRNSLATVVGAGFATIAIAAVLRAYLPESTLFRRMTLAPLEEADRIEQERREQLADYEHLVGKTGAATTTLAPTGRAEIDGEPVDVITRGELVERGEQVEVVEAHANRVVVRRLST